jgi:diguanylate cyclase (GGDEF)-like protein
MRERLEHWLERHRSLTASDSAAMAVALGTLYVAGAVIGSLSLLLPHPAEFDDGALWENISIAAIAGAVLLAARNRIREWMIHLAVIGGIVVVTRAVYYGMDAGGAYTFWYLWVGVYAFFFFGRRWGSAHLAAIGASYAWALNALDASGPITRWVVTLGSIAVVGLLVDALAKRLRGQTESAANRAANLEAVGEVARQLATQSDPRAVGWAICTAAINATGASAAVLWRPTPNGSELISTAAAGAHVEGTRIPFVTPASGAVRAFTGAEPRFANLADHKAAQELAPEMEVGSALWQPVGSDTAVVGVLAVYWVEPREGVEAELRQTVRLLGLEAAIAIERGELLGRLEEAARTDDLTGLHNRRAWSEELARELSRAKREEAPLAVAVLDLDRFKQYNDARGHQAGDRFLKQVAGIWSEELRATDILARHGGEEFVVAMPNTDLEEAEAMLERLRAAVPGDQTVSAGVCLWNGSETADALIARADAAQYEAKAAGRDRVVAT